MCVWVCVCTLPVIRVIYTINPLPGSLRRLRIRFPGAGVPTISGASDCSEGPAESPKSRLSGDLRDLGIKTGVGKC